MVFIVVGGLLLVFWYGPDLQMFRRDLWISCFCDKKKMLGTKDKVTLWINKEKTNIQYGYALRIGTAPVGFSII